jgi:glycosyltransferase involved in cell wall biosynthesis
MADQIHIVFWMNIPSMIMAPSIRWLANHADVDCIFSQGLRSDRIDLGWAIPDFGNAKIFYLNASDPIKEVQSRLLNYSNTETVHLVSGLGSYKVYNPVFTRAKNCLIGVISEAACMKGLRGSFSFLRAKLRRSLLDNRISFICAFGEIGLRYFTALGFPEKKLFPFAYQAPHHFETSVGSSRVPDGFLRLLFVGQQIDRKGIDILLHSMVELPSTVLLTIAGSGSDEMKYRALAQYLKIDLRVNWLGRVANQKLPALYAAHDLVVVPSRFDGWAAVANEGIMSGKPVIISDACGAADMITGTGAGTVFCSDQVTSLSNTIYSYVLAPDLLKNQQNRAYEARECISGEAIGRYLLGIIKYNLSGGDRPVVPWHLSKNV